MILALLAICFLLSVVCIVSFCGYFIWSIFLINFWAGVFALGVALFMLAKFLSFFADDKKQMQVSVWRMEGKSEASIKELLYDMLNNWEYKN